MLDWECITPKFSIYIGLWRRRLSNLISWARKVDPEDIYRFTREYKITIFFNNFGTLQHGHIAFPPTTFVADAYPPLALFAVGWYTCFNWTLSVVREAEGTIFAINLANGS